MPASATRSTTAGQWSEEAQYERAFGEPPQECGCESEEAIYAAYLAEETNQ